MTTDLHALAAAYALDALDDDERVEFEAHLASCESCPAELAKFAEVVGGLAEATGVAAPANVRDRVLAQIGETEQVSASSSSSEVAAAPVADLAERRRRRFSVPNMIAAAAVVALIAIGAVVISAERGSSEYNEVVAAGDAVATQLDGETGTIDVVYSVELDRVAVRGSGLDDLEPGLRYALWAIAGDEAVPAGLFEPGGGSIEFVTELADPSVEAWGVTIEPATGSDQPTSEIIYYAET